VNDLSVILSRVETVGRLRVTVVDERVQVSNWIRRLKILQIGGLARLDSVL